MQQSLHSKLGVSTNYRTGESGTSIIIIMTKKIISYINMPKCVARKKNGGIIIINFDNHTMLVAATAWVVP